MPLFICRMFHVPVSLQTIFLEYASAAYVGQKLEGDPTMPPTFMPSWPSIFNAVRKAFLARFVWKRRTLIEVTREAMLRKYFVGWKSDDGQIMLLPNIMEKQFVAPLSGMEDRTFIIIDARGFEVRFEILGGGTKEWTVELASDKCRKRGIPDWALPTASDIAFV